jgi:hypothetical protein
MLHYVQFIKKKVWKMKIFVQVTYHIVLEKDENMNIGLLLILYMKTFGDEK